MRNKLYLLLIVFMIALSSFVLSDYFVQDEGDSWFVTENAWINQSTNGYCNASRVYDGDWNTFCSRNDTVAVNDEDYYYVNYTLPGNTSRELSYWQIKYDNNVNGMHILNVTLPEECWNNNIQLQIYMDSIGALAPRGHLLCRNSTGWVNLSTGGGVDPNNPTDPILLGGNIVYTTAGLYEDAMVFDILLNQTNNTNFPILTSTTNYNYARGYVFEANKDGYIKQIQKDSQTAEWPITTYDNLTAHIYVFDSGSTTTGDTTDSLVFNPSLTQTANASFSGNIAIFDTVIPILSGQKFVVLVGSKDKLPWQSDTYQSRYTTFVPPQVNPDFNLISEAMGIPNNDTTFRNRSIYGHNIVSILYDNNTLPTLAPKMQTSRMEPTQIKINDNITGYCNATQTQDKNVSYYYNWFINDISVLSGYDGVNYTEGVEQTISILGSGNTSAGDEIIFSCLANSNPNSTWLNSSPSYVNYIPVTNQSYINGTQNNSVNSNLTGYCNVTDLDNNSNITYFYSWYKNNELVDYDDYYYSSANESYYTSYWSQQANLYDNDWETYSSVSNINTQFGYVNYTKQYNAGYAVWEVKDNVARRNITILDDCFSYNDEKIILRYATQGDPNCITGNCDYYYYCYDGNWQLLYTVDEPISMRNYEEAVFFNYNAIKNISYNNTAGILTNIANFSSTETSVVDEFIFSCRGYDGLEFSDWLNSSTFIIDNNIPVITQSEIYPITVLDYNNDAVGACNVTDVDLQNINYSFIWYANDTQIASGVYNNVTQGILTNISTLTINVSQVFKNLTFSCRGYDGYNYSDWLNSSFIFINNSVPIMQQSVTYPDNESESSNDIIGACNGTDINNEQLSINYNWFINDISVLSNSTGFYCYQESSNIATPCGGFDTGTRVAINWWQGLNSLVYDGSYETGRPRQSLADAYLWVNYTIPEHTLNGTLWQLKYDNGSNELGVTRNHTIPYTCIDNGDNNLRLWVHLVTGGNDYFQFNCWDGTSWELIAQSLPHTQDNTWFYEEGVYWKLGPQQGKLTNVSTLDSSYINPGDEVIFSCQADDGVNTSNWLNSSILDIIFSQPIVNELYVTPIYPESTTQLNCNFNTTDVNPGIEYNVSVSWYKDGIIDNTYDYIYVNITDDILYTTDFSNGSYIGTLDNYSVYNCTINVSNGVHIVEQTSTGIGIYPLENLTILSPANNIVTNENLNISFTVVDYNNDIICDLYVNNSLVDSSIVQSETLSYLNYTIPADGYYSYYVNCSSTSNTYTINSTPRLYVYDTTPPYIINLTNTENLTTPEIDDIIFLSGIVSDNNNVSYCSLYINDTGIFLKNETQYVNAVSSSVTFNYTIQEYSLANMSHISWYLDCNDSIGNSNVSLYNSFTVKDISYPNISVTKLGINSNNLSVISNYLYNMSFNITFFDDNLFQAFVNVSCDVDGDIYYWEILDINSTYQNIADTVDLDNYVPQKCYYSFGASDDHTKKKIEDYEMYDVDKGIEFETEAKNKIKIQAKDTKNQYNKINIKKEKDRYNFNFEFEEKELEREFEVYVDSGIVYYRPNSKYGGHFVIWNEETNKGNWLDFQLKEPNEYLKYNVQKIADNHYTVRMYVDVPSNVDLERPKFMGISYGPKNKKELELYLYGMDNIEFDSIGGTNIEILNYEFYIGGAVNVSGIDLYDNTTLENISVNVTNIVTFPGVNSTQGYTVNGVSGIIQNLSNGTYLFEFYKDNQFILRDYVVNVNASLVSQLYETAESVVTVNAINIKSGQPVYNAFISVNKNGTSEYRNATGDNTTSVFTFWLDADDYNITGTAPLYDTTTGAFTTVYMENKSFNLPMIFLTIFNLMDEKTIAPFNINSPDNVNFILICEDSQYTYQVTNQTQQFPIICNYTQFKFDLEYGGESYYRKLIIDPDIVDNIFNQTVWLIDLNTTTAIYNSIFIDDLLQDYDDTQIFVYKIIDDAKEQITADFTDVEGKIGAYLIRNHEYIIEVHSSNNPIRLMGSYSADLEGDKTVRLYDISTGGNPTGFVNDVSFNTQTQNISGTMYATASYSDLQNKTSSVTWTLYEGEFGGPVLFTTTITRPANGSADFTGLYNISQYENETIISHMTFVHDLVGTNRYSRILQQANEIPLEIVEFVGQNLINWFFTLLIGLLAIMATIRTGNLISMFLVLAASLFVIFGWFQLSVGILALAALVALMAIIKGGIKPE